MRNPDSDIIMPLKTPERAVDENGKPLAGRPKVFIDPIRAHIMFEKSDLDYVRGLGDGSASLGVRLLVQMAKSNRPAGKRRKRA